MLVSSSTHRVCENAAVTVIRLGCNRGDYKLGTRWSPDWWIFGECGPSGRENSVTQTQISKCFIEAICTVLHTAKQSDWLTSADGVGDMFLEHWKNKAEIEYLNMIYIFSFSFSE